MHARTHGCTHTREMDIFDRERVNAQVRTRDEGRKRFGVKKTHARR